MRKVMMFLVVLLGITGVLAQEQLTEGAIREGALEWQELFNQGDWDALAQRYAEDAVFYGFDGVVHEGREAIRDSLAEPLPGDPENPQIEVTVEAVYLLEDGWVDVGSWVIRAQDGSELLRGNYMGFGQLVDAQPLIVRHIANMVLPEGMMGEQEGN